MRPHAVLATLGLICSVGAAAGASLLLLPSLTGRAGYYELLVSGSTVRLAATGVLGCLLGLPSLMRPGQSRWLGWVALTLGAASAGLSAALTAPVFVTARALGAPVSLTESLLGAAASNPASPEVVTFASGDSWRLDGDLYRPATSAGSLAPVVVVIHGGAWQGGDKGENVPWNHWLVERGYVVLDIQYRLAPAADWQAAVSDIQLAVRWIRAHAASLGVDVERVALLGRSAGGHLALMAAYSEHVSGELVPSAVIALYPPTDLTRLYADLQGSQADELREAMDAALGGTPSAVPTRFEAASPAKQVRRGVPPTLLIHGTWDDLVPPVQSRLLASALTATGAPVQLVEIPYARHAFDVVHEAPASQLARAVVATFLRQRQR